MANTLQASVRKGIIVPIFNQTFKSFDFFRRTKRGKFVSTNPFVKNSTIGQISYHKKQVDKMKNGE